MEIINKKSNFRLTIGNKILASFLVLIILFVVNVFIIVSRGNVIDNAVNRSSEVDRPSKDAINKFELLVNRSKMLVTNWVYLQTNAEDKTALKQLQDHDYPELYDRIRKLMPSTVIFTTPRLRSIICLRLTFGALTSMPCSSK